MVDKLESFDYEKVITIPVRIRWIVPAFSWLSQYRKTNGRGRNYVQQEMFILP